MAMDNASLAMELLRAATEQNEATTPSAEPSSDSNANLDTNSSNKLPEYVSQFHIDGQPILPPLMTAEKRQLMRQLRERAVQLEAKYKQTQAIKSTTDVANNGKGSSNRGSSKTSISGSSSSSSSSSNLNNSTMENPHRLPQLQQTETFIYDSTRRVHSILDRPQTLYIEPKRSSLTNVIPTICVNPPTPLCELPKPQSTPNLQAMPQPQSQSQPTPKVQPMPQPQSQSQPTPKVQPMPQPQPQSQSKPKVQPMPQPQSQSQATPKVQPMPQPQPQSQPKPKVQPMPQPQPQSQPKPKVQPMPQPQSQSTHQLKSQFQSKPQFQSQPQFLCHSQSQPRLQSHSQFQSLSQPHRTASKTAPELKDSHRSLSTHHRKLNNITTRILQFESTGLGKVSPQKPEPAELLWQNETIVISDKRMMRSSTSPLLSAALTNEGQLHRSRSFTLEEPSPALVEHMKREGQKQLIPPPVPPPRATVAAAATPPITASAPMVTPRCRFPASASCCSSAHSLAHLRRDTIESKAKQVQRSVSSSIVDTLKYQSAPATAAAAAASAGRRRGGVSTRQQQQQQQLEELLQRALHETHSVAADQQHLALAKKQMFKDIKSAHRDRFQQLVQYQHEEQRRMQEEFDRQQKFLIEQICTEINVSAYAHESLSGGRSPTGVSEYTSTDDLPTPSQISPSDTITPISMDTLSLNTDTVKDSASTTARKRLFDVGSESEGPMERLLQSTASSPKALPLRSRNTNTNAKANINKKTMQRSQSKPPMSKNGISSAQLLSKTPPPRRVANKTTTPTPLVTKPNSRQQQQQQLTAIKSRRSGSPSRSTRFVAKK